MFHFCDVLSFFFVEKNRNDLDSKISSRKFVFSFSQFWMIPTRSCLLIRNFGFKEKIKVVRTGGFTVHPFSGPETEIFSRKKFKNDFRTRRINWTIAKMDPKNWMVQYMKLGRAVGNNEKLETFKLESSKWNWKEWSWKVHAEIGKTFQLPKWPT